MLPDDQREALILIGAGGFSYEEAAEICGIAVGTIKSRVSRARDRLALIYADGKIIADGHSPSGATDSILQQVNEYSRARCA
jgi:RNA polymerase sigma-70 factor (ECF subfamily)